MYDDLELDQLYDALAYDEFCNDRADGLVYAFMNPDEYDASVNGGEITKEEWVRSGFSYYGKVSGLKSALEAAQ